jgi:hypothetical protein
MRILTGISLLIVGTLANQGQFLLGDDNPVINYNANL